MDREKILDAVAMLAQSQGFYGRLLRFLTSGTDEAENMLAEMEAQNFGDTLDMVLWLEE